MREHDTTADLAQVETTAPVGANLAMLAEVVAEVNRSHSYDITESRNLGNYRTEVTCTCGETLWWGTHEGDPTKSEVWHVNHVGEKIAEALLAALAARPIEGPEPLATATDETERTVQRIRKKWRNRSGEDTADIYHLLTLLKKAQHTDDEVQWGVQEKETLDGPWGRIDDGRGWSFRSGCPYTEDEARTEAAKRINGYDPTTWRRVVKHTVGAWEVDQR